MTSTAKHIWEEYMPDENDKNWLELCDEAVQAKDTHELMRILRELDRALEREKQIRHQSRKQTCGGKSL
jgi:hypothetical protein